MLVSKHVIQFFGLFSLVAAHGLSSLPLQEGDSAHHRSLPSSSFQPFIRGIRVGSKHHRHRSIGDGIPPVSKSVCTTGDTADWYPIYKRKAVNAHHDNSTLHHFDDRHALESFCLKMNIDKAHCLFEESKGIHPTKDSSHKSRKENTLHDKHSSGSESDDEQKTSAHPKLRAHEQHIHKGNYSDRVPEEHGEYDKKHNKAKEHNMHDQHRDDKSHLVHGNVSESIQKSKSPTEQTKVRPSKNNKEVHSSSHRKHTDEGEHADKIASGPTRTGRRPKQTDDDPVRRNSGGYHLVKKYAGSTFFDDFFFFTAGDPSGGMIDYVDKGEARSAGLIGTKNGNAFMKIGHGHNGVQKAVRISTEDTFTSGIFVLDAYHMPTGCGVWPSFWTTPRDPPGGWPRGGEIDLIEGVHYFGRNMYSIHAPSWCSVPDSVDMLGKLAMPNKALAHNCDPHKTDDQGCGVQSQTDGDYGDAYNHQGGGVHVLDWDSNSGIRAYFFPRNKIPGDIEAGDPKPWTWGTPKASWPSIHCKPDDYFQKHVAVFTNTVCGTWAGASSVWNNKMSGQSFTCKAHTGKNSCYDYMTSGADLSKAYWEIKSLKIYQTSRRK